MTASSSGLGSLPISLVWVNAGRTSIREVAFWSCTPNLLYETLPDTDDGHVTAVEIVSVVDGRRDLATEG